VGDDWNGFTPGKEWHETRDEIADDLERQARETLDAIRESAGELGGRVRKALDHATILWNSTGPGAPSSTDVSPEDEARARALARRW
jgi:hypothetical protein